MHCGYRILVKVILAVIFTCSFSFVLKIQFEAYLAKLATENLRMTNEEYEALTQKCNQRLVMDHLEQRSIALSVPIYNLQALYQSLLQDHMVASRTHRDWEPAEVSRVTTWRFSFKFSTPICPISPLKLYCAFSPSITLNLFKV